MHSYSEIYLGERTLFLIKNDIIKLLIYIYHRHLPMTYSFSISGKFELVSNGRLIT